VCASPTRHPDGLDRKDHVVLESINRFGFRKIPQQEKYPHRIGIPGNTNVINVLMRLEILDDGRCISLYIDEQLELRPDALVNMDIKFHDDISVIVSLDFNLLGLVSQPAVVSLLVACKILQIVICSMPDKKNIQ
jgi:hypothetical protein